MRELHADAKAAGVILLNEVRMRIEDLNEMERRSLD